MQDCPVSPPGSSDPYHGFSDGSSHEDQYPMLSNHEAPSIHPPVSNYLGRRHLVLGCIGLVFTLTLLMSFVTLTKRSIPEMVQEPEVADYSNPNIDLLNPSLYLNGPPTAGFRGMRSTEARGYRP